MLTINRTYSIDEKSIRIFDKISKKVEITKSEILRKVLYYFADKLEELETVLKENNNGVGEQ